MSAVKYHNDQWTLELEELGFDHVATELATMVLHSRPPFAACVAGRWGSGKTSVMQYVAALLGGERTSVRVPYTRDQRTDSAEQAGQDLGRVRNLGKRLYEEAKLVPLFQFDKADWKTLRKSADGSVATMWFSPWRFQNDPNPMVPLLHGLREQLSTWARARKNVNKTARVTVEAGLEMLSRLADGAAKLATDADLRLREMPGAIRGIGERVEREQLDVATDAERFSLLFEAAIETILGISPGKNDQPKAHRLVIFIDDLDRCEGATALKLLEAIKLYLSTRYCVFVFGLDVTAAEASIGELWSGKNRRLAREYLDKLFQSYVHMPISNRYPLFVHNRLCDYKLLPSEVERLAADSNAQAHKSAHFIADMLPRNPRKVKNFINGLRLAWMVSQRDGRDITVEQLGDFALVQRLRAIAPATFSYLCQSAEDHLPVFGKFLAACAAQGEIDHRGDFHQKAIMLAEFSHVARPEEGWHKLDLAVSANLQELSVRVDSLQADRHFIDAWLKAQMSADAFCLYAGILRGGPAA